MSLLLDHSTTSGPRRPGAARRPEIDGLRAVAVALVVGYHVWTGRVSGGVDVFLALSGFFLVHSLLGQVERSGRVRPLTSISRTLSRLVPPAALVLAGTVAASALVLPETRWRELAGHLLASATFTENRHLVVEATDYAASNAMASPMQQFWSLSIQVQVLVAAPFVVAAGALLLRGRRELARPAAVLAVAAVTVASFAWSVVATRADQQVAYFSTLPRLWELGAGALLALTLGGVRPGRRTGVLLGWGAAVALVACGAVLDGAHTFPGWQAAWPVACALVLLLVADSGGRYGVHRLLRSRSLRWLGARSYALYLWHWPVLVLYLVHTGRDAPSMTGATAVILLSLVLAEATHRLVEQPAAGRLRRRPPVRALGLVAAGMAPLLALGAVTTVWLDREATRVAAASDDPAYPGALALSVPAAAIGAPVVEPLPSLSVIRDDWPGLPGADCWTEQEEPAPVPADTEICVLGGDDRERRIVVVGDSHASQWLSPLAELAETHDWQVVSLVRGGCNLSTESEFVQEGWPGYEECVTWRSHLVQRIVGLEPDLVVSLGTRTATGEEEERLPPGFVAAWQQLSDAGLQVVGMRDSPRHPHDVPDCLAAAQGDGAAECGTPRSLVYTDEVLGTAESALPAGVTLLDTSAYFCSDVACPAVVGNVRVYLDSGHVTATYMRTVRPLLEADLFALTGW